METSTDHSTDGLVAFAKRRAIPGGLFSSWCTECGCQMRVDAAHLMEEFRGEAPLCAACRSGGTAGSYGGSPQSRSDNAYHGGRYHSAEWEG